MAGKKQQAMSLGQRPSHVDESDWNAMQSELKQNVSESSMTMQQLQNATPEQLGNDPKMEMVWAEKAGRHAETYMNLLRIVEDKKKMRLTKCVAAVLCVSSCDAHDGRCCLLSEWMTRSIAISARRLALCAWT